MTLQDMEKLYRVMKKHLDLYFAGDDKYITATIASRKVDDMFTIASILSGRPTDEIICMSPAWIKAFIDESLGESGFFLYCKEVRGYSYG